MKKVSLFLLLAFFGTSYTAQAESSLSITEIMYDLPGSDDGHEWVEVGNPTGAPVDLTGWKVVDDGSTKHVINLPGKNGGIGSIVLPAGGYLVLADNAATFLADHPDFSGTVLDTTLSLNNTGATLKLIDKSGNEAFSTAYASSSGASGDGNTLQVQPDGSWVASAATPGAANAAPPPFTPPDPTPTPTPADTPPPSADDTASDSSSDQTQSDPQPDDSSPTQAQSQAPALQISINEIMYDLSGTDDGREWVEVYNAGASDVDLTSLKFFEAQTNHNITAYNDGSSTLPAGSYAVIADNPAKFLQDFPAYQGLLFDSSFSLSNTGESLALKDADGNIVDQLAYDSSHGAGGDGNSLQKSNDAWLAAGPTPGVANKTAAESAPEQSDSGSSQDSSAAGGSGGGPSQSPAKKSAKKASFKIDAPAYVITNSSFTLSASGLADEQGKYSWNFGNADEVAVQDSASVDYSYQFPGQYLVTLSLVKDGSAAAVKATVKIKAEDNPISISSVKEDGSVELKNQATHQEDISGWSLKEGDASFTIPAETVILADSRVVLPAKVTKLPAGPGEIDLLYPSGSAAFIFNKAPAETVSKPAVIPVQTARSTVPAAVPAPAAATAASASADNVAGAELSASAANSVPAGKSEPLFPWLLGLGGIIIVSSSLSLMIAPKGLHFFKSGQPDSSSDFKIIS